METFQRCCLEGRQCRDPGSVRNSDQTEPSQDTSDTLQVNILHASGVKALALALAQFDHNEPLKDIMVGGHGVLHHQTG